jgi:hypothetical protein
MLYGWFFLLETKIATRLAHKARLAEHLSESLAVSALISASVAHVQYFGIPFLTVVVATQSYIPYISGTICIINLKLVDMVL